MIESGTIDPHHRVHITVLMWLLYPKSPIKSTKALPASAIIFRRRPDHGFEHPAEMSQMLETCRLADLRDAEMRMEPEQYFSLVNPPVIQIFKHRRSGNLLK